MRAYVVSPDATSSTLYWSGVPSDPRTDTTVSGYTRSYPDLAG